ncbi:MAG: hypothetical protein KME25_22575 [Symplocastrum torsivum CPER-KK1]|uniref:Uncharacterized protein n=1 Tax=Symplocastrum torsivum CPER-KK1 TaxID=450513 RepID=A0A951PPV9_9CYAN|nr:hypothetical protein [Symplocastrum torsivum CPER-KK1]
MDIDESWFQYESESQEWPRRSLIQQRNFHKKTIHKHSVGAQDFAPP